MTKQWKFAVVAALVLGVFAALSAALVLGVFAALSAVLAPGEVAVPRAYQCNVYTEQGCDKYVVASGGEIEIQSGGTADIQSGATTGWGAAMDFDSTLNVDGAVTMNSTVSVGSDLTVTGDILGNTNIISKTTSYTLLTTESGSIATNLGASAGLTFTLPAATAGLRYCFYVGAGQIITVTPGSSDYILHLTNAADDRINNAASAGDSVCLTAIDVTHWIPTGETGTWSDTN